MQAHVCRALLITFFAGQAACATKAPPKPQQMDCASAHFPIQLSMAGALEGFAGRYSDGARSLALRQDGYVVLVAEGARERELRAAGDWRFVDGCGVTYQLSLPLNGTGASLEVIAPGGKSTRLRRVSRDHG